MKNTIINNKKRLWQGIPGLEKTENGRIFVTWFSGGDKEPHSENKIYICYSDNKSETFTEPALIVDPSGKNRAFDPNLWIDSDNKLWLIYNRGNKENAEHGIYARICVNPDKSILDWDEEFLIDLDVPFNFRLNKPIVLSSGSWIMPVTYATEPTYGWFANQKQLQGVAISTDKGQSWTLHGELKAPHWALENMIVELNDGRLWMLIRTGDGFLWESFSSDGGKTWSSASPSNISNPGSRFFIRRLNSGDLLLVNHYKYTGRSHLTAQISTDEGKTWNEGLLLDEREGVSYPDGVQDNNGKIWIVYDRDRKGAGEILLATFHEEDVIAGENKSGDVNLKQIVNKL
ncbi:MAG: sialidase family protein [bacterium]